MLNTEFRDTELEAMVDAALNYSHEYTTQDLIRLQFEVRGKGVTLRKYEQLKGLIREREQSS